MGPFSKKIWLQFMKGSSKNSYERRYYESVDEKNLSQAMSRKTTKKEFEVLRIKFWEMV